MLGINRALVAIAAISLLAAIILAVSFDEWTDTDAKLPFLLQADTYKIILPFLLTTVTVGLLGLVYAQHQKDQERIRDRSRKNVAVLGERIRSLRSFFSDVLDLFQLAKRARRDIRIYCRPTDDGAHEIRYKDILAICEALTAAELMAEAIVKRLQVEPELVEGVAQSAYNAKETVLARRDLLIEHIDGLRQVLREVARAAEWTNLGGAVTDEKEWTALPAAFIVFAQRAHTRGQFGFHGVASNFDEFTAKIQEIIRQLEQEREAFAVVAETAPVA